MNYLYISFGLHFSSKKFFEQSEFRGSGTKTKGLQLS